MLLSFTQVATLAAGEKINIGHEPGNELIQYFARDNRISNEVSYPDRGQYTSLSFGSLESRVPPKNYGDFGIKTFPRMGAYGWFRYRYEDTTHILIPLGQTEKRYAAPTIAAVQNADSITITLTSPSSVEYDCFRILFRQGFFATEYITYDNVITLPKPHNGTYELYAIGHRNTGEVSHESARQAITITGSTTQTVGAPVANAKDGTTLALWLGTESEYGSVGEPDSNTVYFRKGD